MSGLNDWNLVVTPPPFSATITIADCLYLLLLREPQGISLSLSLLNNKILNTLSGRHPAGYFLFSLSFFFFLVFSEFPTAILNSFSLVVSTFQLSAAMRGADRSGGGRKKCVGSVPNERGRRERTVMRVRVSHVSTLLSFALPTASRTKLLCVLFRNGTLKRISRQTISADSPGPMNLPGNDSFLPFFM